MSVEESDVLDGVENSSLEFFVNGNLPSTVFSELVCEPFSNVNVTRQLPGRKICEPNPLPETSLLSYLRVNLRLSGTKLGCGEGGCGACTVMVSHNQGGMIKHLAVNACLTPLVAMHGMAVTTVEGIGNIK